MAAVKLRDGETFDGAALAEVVCDQLPSYAVPLFVRLVSSMAHTTTFKSRKVELREQGYGAGGAVIEEPLYVLAAAPKAMCPSTPNTRAKWPPVSVRRAERAGPDGNQAP